MEFRVARWVVVAYALEWRAFVLRGDRLFEEELSR